MVIFFKRWMVTPRFGASLSYTTPFSDNAHFFDERPQLSFLYVLLEKRPCVAGRNGGMEPRTTAAFIKEDLDDLLIKLEYHYNKQLDERIEREREEEERRERRSNTPLRRLSPRRLRQPLRTASRGLRTASTGLLRSVSAGRRRSKSPFVRRRGKEDEPSPLLSRIVVVQEAGKEAPAAASTRHQGLPPPEKEAPPPKAVTQRRRTSSSPRRHRQPTRCITPSTVHDDYSYYDDDDSLFGRELGFFEVLGRNMDDFQRDLQRTWCSNAQKTRREEPPVVLKRFCAAQKKKGLGKNVSL